MSKLYHLNFFYFGISLIIQLDIITTSVNKFSLIFFANELVSSSNYVKKICSNRQGLATVNTQSTFNNV